MAVIAFMNQKGGVGKTTTTINLAAQSSLKSKTLMVDSDMQANLTSQFIEPTENSIRKIFEGEKISPIKIKKKLDLIPSHINMVGVENLIMNEPGREAILKRALKSYKKHEYKNIFIDCPPNISLITMNALVAAQYVVIPIRASMFSIDGIEKMLEFVSKVRENYNQDLTILGILLTQLDGRVTTINRRIREELGKIGLEKHILKTVIRRNVEIEKSQFNRKGVLDYNRKSRAAADYAALGYELQSKIRKIEKA